jgi:hypothetical protein
MTPRRCDRNTSELPQYGQGRLESGFIPNAPYYASLGYTQAYDQLMTIRTTENLLAAIPKSLYRI